MRRSLKEFLTAVLKRWWLIVAAILGDLAGMVLIYYQQLRLPIWVWITIPVLALFIAQFLAFHDVRRKRDDLQAQLGERAKRRQIAGELAAFVMEAKNNISPLFGVSIDGLRRTIPAWDRKVEAYLTERVGPDYVARFRIGAGLITNPVPPRIVMHEREWHHVQTRLARLAEFMKELAG